MRSNEKLKTVIFQGCQATKPVDLYINENLTPTCNTIMGVPRKARKDFTDIVSGYCATDGSVYVWIRPPNTDTPGPRDSRMQISTFGRPKKFCTEIIDSTVTRYVSDWQN